MSHPDETFSMETKSGKTPRIIKIEGCWSCPHYSVGDSEFNDCNLTGTLWLPIAGREDSLTWIAPNCPLEISWLV